MLDVTELRKRDPFARDASATARLTSNSPCLA
jgi:hypothetical protein